MSVHVSVVCQNFCVEEVSVHVSVVVCRLSVGSGVSTVLLNCGHSGVGSVSMKGCR